MDYEEGRARFEKECRWVEQGSEKYLERHHTRGRLHATERINMLVDKGSWLEYGKFARSVEKGFKERSPRYGIMTGLGKVNGIAVAIIADDVTILGATTSHVNTRKLDRIIEIATRNHLPIISLAEGGGVRLPDGIGVGFPRFTGLHALNSLGVLTNPQRRPVFICAVMGYSYGDPAFRAGMADITFMVEDSSVAVSAPMVIGAAISEKTTDIDLGGPSLHQTQTGTVDIVLKTEEKCIQTIKRLLNILRPHETSKDPLDRLIPEIESLVPFDNKRVYDMRKVIDRICDSGEWMELKPHFGKGLLVGLGRLGGHLVGIIASQPALAGGSIDAKGLRKSAAFLELALLRRIPLLVIQDIPGFLIGSAVEKDSMISAIARHARILDSLDIPMVTLVIRKAYGAAYYFLGMSASGSQYAVAWPNAEISFMSPQIGASVLTKHVDSRIKPEVIQETVKTLELGSSIWDLAYEFWIDAVILPETTRKVICQAFSFLAWDHDHPAGKETSHYAATTGSATPIWAIIAPTSTAQANVAPSMSLLGNCMVKALMFDQHLNRHVYRRITSHYSSNRVVVMVDGVYSNTSQPPIIPHNIWIIRLLLYWHNLKPAEHPRGELRELFHNPTFNSVDILETLQRYHGEFWILARSEYNQYRRSHR